jgi:predicted transcriptional regulator
MITMYRKEVRYKDSEESLLLKAFGNSPKLRIIDIFLTNPLFDFSKNELARELGMSKQTLYKCFKDLEDLGMVKITRKIGRANLYRINLENPMVKMLNEYVTQLSLQVAEREKAKMQKPMAVEAKR